jgi:hypothetical protein
MWGKNMKDEVLMLQDLVNLSCVPTVIMGDDGYFLCTAEFLTDSIWTFDQQRKFIKRVEEKGYIKIKQKGLPARRWVFVDVDKIERELNTFLGGVIDASKDASNDASKDMPNDAGKNKEELPYGSSSSKGKKKERRRSRDDSSPLPNSLLDDSTDKIDKRKTTFPTEDSFEKKCAKKLQRILLNHKIYRKVKNANMDTWAKEFTSLLIDGVSKEDIEEALEWYMEHIGEEHMPEAHSANSFCDKYRNILCHKKVYMAKQRRGKPIDEAGYRNDEYVDNSGW